MESKKKYQTGIQETVLEIIKQSKSMNLDYITKKQIVKEAKKSLGDVDNINDKVGQALNVLQKRTTFRLPRVKKYYDEFGKRRGWTIVSDMWFWKNGKVFKV